MMLQKPVHGPGIWSGIDVYVDFDGTIAPNEPTDQLFDRFADPAWRDIDQSWLDGHITSWEAAAQNATLLRAGPEEITAFLRHFLVDPGFPDFVDLCRRNGARVTVISDGFDVILRTVLGAAGLNLPFVANQLVWQGGDRWEARFPHRRADCRFKMGNCKYAHRLHGDTALNVMVGDGRSDFCIAERCQLVIAKGSLFRRCQEHGLPHIAMSGFTDAKAQFAQWLSDQRAGTASKHIDASHPEMLGASLYSRARSIGPSSPTPEGE